MSASEARDVSCAGCGAPLPETAKFCPACGRPVDADTGTTVRAEVPPEETGRVPLSISRVQPRWFGVTPPMLLLGLAVAALVLAVVLFATGRWPVALILLGIAILVFTAFLEVARRKPDTAVSRLSVGAFDDVRARAGSALESLAVRGRAGRDAIRLRNDLVQVHAYRRELLTAFGDAVYRDDESGAETLRASLGEADARAAALEAELHALAVATRDRIEKARLAVQQTEMVSVPEPYPPPDEGTPPTPAPVPEPSPPPDELTPPQPDPVPTPGPEPSPGPPSPDPGSADRS